MIPLLIFALVVVAGVMMFIRGWNGITIDDHPICRKCGFDLFGLPPGATRCSECGADLTRPRAIRAGARSRQRGLIVSGLILIAFAGSALALVGWARVSQFDPNPWKPLSWVLADAKLTKPAATRAAAFAELRRRIAASELTQADIDAVADVGLAHQADVSQPWLPEWGGLIELLRAGQQLSDERWRRYAKQAGMFQLELRPKVRRGDPIPVRVARPGARVGPVPKTGTLWLRMHFKNLTIAGVTRRQGGSIGTVLQPHGGGSGGSNETLTPQELAALKDGPQTVRITLEIEVSEYQPAAADPDNATAIVKSPVELEGTFELIPAAEQTVTTVHAPEHADAVRKAIEVRDVRYAQWEKDRLSFMIDVDPTPVTLAHDVIARAAGREVKLGTVAAHPNRGASTNIGGRFEDLRAERIDIVLRPNVAVAHGSIDVFEVWDGEIVIPDMKVARYDPSTRRSR